MKMIIMTGTMTATRIGMIPDNNEGNRDDRDYGNNDRDDRTTVIQ